MWTRVKQWWARKEQSERPTPWLDVAEQPLADSVYWVLDLESDGLHPKKNRILSIGAVTVAQQRLQYGSSYYRLLLYRGKLRGDSLLIHGLSPSELAKGKESKQVLHELCEQGQDKLWVGFHAGFDAQLLQNAFWQELNWSVRPSIINIAEYLPMLVDESADSHNTLEYWANYFQLDGVGRHNALGDASVTAELLLVVIAKAHALELYTWAQLNERLKQWRQIRLHLQPSY